MLIMNCNPLFGHPGPYEAESIEALCRDMTPSFEMWLDERYNDYSESSQEEGFKPESSSKWKDRHRDAMKDAFVSGLVIQVICKPRTDR